MAHIEWDNALYSVKIDEFDNHHKRIVDYINELHSAMMVGKGKEALHEILHQLKEYTQYHFKAEEEKMIDANYPFLEEHKKEHRKLIQMLTDRMKDYEKGSMEVSVDTFKFLKQWLFDHIQGTDRKYTSYLKN